MTFAQSIQQFFKITHPPTQLPPQIDLLWPYRDPEVQAIVDRFYSAYFDDSHKRIFLIGINPGRFGAGKTGICFTDPNHLADDCGIEHSFGPGRELSSDFIYRVIAEAGGPKAFYSRVYLTALSPAGFTKDGKNINYYDVKGFALQLDSWMADCLKRQIQAGADTTIAFSIGMGEHFKQLKAFNDRHGFFDRIKALPHPRWVMQYRRKELSKHIQCYLDCLAPSHNAP